MSMTGFRILQREGEPFGQRFRHGTRQFLIFFEIGARRHHLSRVKGNIGGIPWQEAARLFHRKHDRHAGCRNRGDGIDLLVRHALFDHTIVHLHHGDTRCIDASLAHIGGPVRRFGRGRHGPDLLAFEILRRLDRAVLADHHAHGRIISQRAHGNERKPARRAENGSTRKDQAVIEFAGADCLRCGNRTEAAADGNVDATLFEIALVLCDISKKIRSVRQPRQGELHRFRALSDRRCREPRCGGSHW